MSAHLSYKHLPKFTIEEKEALLEEIYISPLGHLMVKFYLPTSKIWRTFNIGKWEDIIIPHLSNYIKEEIVVK